MSTEVAVNEVKCHNFKYTMQQATCNAIHGT